MDTLAWKLYQNAFTRDAGGRGAAGNNRRFYAGDQWRSESSDALASLPHPVFNVVSRVVSYLVNAVCSHDLAVVCSSDDMPLFPPLSRSTLDGCVDSLNRAVSCLWEKDRMNKLVRDAVLDAALTGDGVFYSWWDASSPIPDIRTEAADPCSLFPSDSASPDLQSQDWLILAGRVSAQRLAAQVRAANGAKDAEQVLRDAAAEAEDDGKVTCLLRFYRTGNGAVAWEKCTRSVCAAQAVTALTRYPLAKFSWIPSRGSFHGASPITSIIGNQRYVNLAYAMAMKHMTDTAFSKVIYDKKLIPEWTNEVGQCIGVVSGGDVSNSVKTVGVGEMQDDYLQVVDSVIRYTKELSGATEAALGESEAVNTSALIALQNAADVPLESVRASLYDCVEAVALNWADLMRAYYSPVRAAAFGADFTVLKGELLSARVDVGAASAFSQLTQIAALDKLLDGGHITAAQYLRHLPSGVLADRDELVRELEGGGKERPSAAAD